MKKLLFLIPLLPLSLLADTLQVPKSVLWDNNNNAVRLSATKNGDGSYSIATVGTGNTTLQLSKNIATDNNQNLVRLSAFKNNDGSYSLVVTGGGGGGTPGGSNGQVQYNNAGAFGGLNTTTVGQNLLNLAAPAADGYLVTANAAGTVTTKDPATLIINSIKDSTDPTKILNIDISAFTTGTTKTLTFDNAGTVSLASLGATTVGGNLLRATNPSAITFPKVAADNTVSFRTPAQVLSDIGAQASGSYAGLTANTFTSTQTIATGSVSADTPGLAITQTWNNAAVAFTPLTITATDTASTSATTAFLNFKIGSTSQFNVNKGGIVTANTGFVAGANTVGAAAGTYLIYGRLYQPTSGDDLYIGSTGLNNKVHVQGTTTNDNESAGYRGEYAESLVAIGSPQSLSNGTAANVTSISLTAGDWDVSGIVNFTETTSTVTARSAGITSTSATVPTDGSEGYCGVQSTVTSETNSISLPRKRISVASTTIVYLVAKASFSAGTCGGFGQINARRVR